MKERKRRYSQNELASENVCQDHNNGIFVFSLLIKQKEKELVAIMFNTYREHSVLIMTMTLFSDINDFFQGSERWREHKLLV